MEGDHASEIAVEGPRYRRHLWFEMPLGVGSVLGAGDVSVLDVTWCEGHAT